MPSIKNTSGIRLPMLIRILGYAGLIPLVIPVWLLLDQLWFGLELQRCRPIWNLCSLHIYCLQCRYFKLYVWHIVGKLADGRQ